MACVESDEPVPRVSRFDISFNPRVDVRDNFVTLVQVVVSSLIGFFVVG